MDHDSDDDIDMAIWTQRTATSAPFSAVTGKPKQEEMSQMLSAPTFENATQRASSVDSTESTGSIPFNSQTLPDEVRNGYQDRPLVTSDTITVQQTTDVVDVNGTGSHKPLQMVFLEGHTSLRRFPRSLLHQLEEACRVQNTEHPDCIKSNWSSTVTLSTTGGGCSARFIAPSTGEELIAARYRYPTRHHIVVVKLPRGTKINGTDVAIVVHSHFDSDNSFSSKDSVYHAWKIWDPYSHDKNAKYVLREIKRDAGTAFDQTTSIVVNVGRKDGKPRTSLPNIARQVLQPTKGVEQSNVAVSTHQTSKRTIEGTQGNSTTSVKRTRQSSQRDSTTSHIFARRASDGIQVRLLCPRCSRRDFATIKGLFTHCALVHDLIFDSPEHGIQVCGIPMHDKDINDAVSQPNATPSPRLGPISSTDALEAASKPTNTMIPHPSATSPHDNQACFVFQGQADDPNPRIRPLDSCNTPKKLFVHAIAAGIAKKNTLMLKVQIGQEKPIPVVRGDMQDFDEVMKAIAGGQPSDNLRAVVTAEDLED